MDWNKFSVLGGQLVVVVVLGVLVALGHDGPTLTALLVVAGSVAGQSLLHSVQTITSAAGSTSK